MIKRGDSGSKLILNHPSLIDEPRKSKWGVRVALYFFGCVCLRD
jgi:hypothetical protein